MSKTAQKKVLVKKPTRITTDERGRSIWADAVETAELELVSTQMLKVILSSRDDSDRKAIESAAKNTAEGVLARNPSSGDFEIIEDDELQAILDGNQGLPELTRPADVTLEPLRDYADDAQLSLVSTQALRKVLSENSDGDDELEEHIDASSFDPYNRG